MVSDNGKPTWRELLSSAIRAPFETRRLQLREAERQAAVAEYESAQAEYATEVLKASAQLVEPERDGFIPIGADTRKLTETDSQNLREQARKFAAQNTHAIGYLNTLKRFVMGEGVQIAPELDEEDERIKQLEDWWEKFRKWNNWDRLEDEIPVRTWRDGESFVRRFVSDGISDPRVSQDVERALQNTNIGRDFLRDVEGPPEGMLILRFLDPDHIKDPKGKISHGIITAEDDVQTVLGYMWAPDGKLKEVIPARDVIHTKIRVDSDVKRGRSVLEPILQRSKQYEQWLKYRLALNLARTALVIDKTVKGTSSQIQSIRDAEQTDRDNINTQKLKMPKPATTVTHGEGIEYKLQSPNINATDAKEDGRSILLSMAAAAGIAEYIFTGDASNANFASTLVAESPTHRTFLDWQDTFKPVFEQVWRWTMIAAADAGQIEFEVEEIRELTVQVSYPPLQQRDIEALAKALQIARLEKIISKQGMAEELGIDWEVERERLEKEGMDDFEFTPPPAEEPEQEEGVNV